MDYREALDIFSTNALNIELLWEKSICLVAWGEGSGGWGGKQEVEGN